LLGGFFAKKALRMERGWYEWILFVYWFHGNSDGTVTASWCEGRNGWQHV